MSEQALSKIPPYQAIWMVRGAVFAGLLSFAFTLWAIKAGVLGLNAWSLIDAAILLGLAIGVLRRSYMCAWLLFGYHVVNRVWMYFAQGRAPGSLAFVLGVFYFLGIVGIVALGPSAKTSDASRASESGTESS